MNSVKSDQLASDSAFLLFLSKIINPYHEPFLFRETPKEVLLQTVKTQMKCSIMLHFIGVYTVCKGKKIFTQMF